VRTHRPALTLLAALALAATGLSTTTVAAQAANTDIKINEVESSGGLGAGGTAADWIELTNTGTAPVAIGGWILKDNVDTNRFEIPAGTTLAPGGYAVFDTDVPNSDPPGHFGLGGGDSARLFLPDNTTLIDTYTWTTAATVTWGRCANGTGPFVDTTSSTRGAANACPPPTSPVKINEIESDDGASPDWVELRNTATTPVDVSGYVLKDSAETAGYTIPVGTTVAAGGYLVVEVPTLPFGLGGGDAVRAFLPGEATPYDSFAWTAHAATTYGRCPNGTGPLVTTTSPTKGGANSCPGDVVAGAWPGGSQVTTVDSPSLAAQVTSNLSGLAYEGSGTTAPGTLWGVLNGPGTLFKLQRSGTTWGQAGGDWAAGKVLRYPDGTGNVDAEGVTLTDAGSAGGIFVSTERNNDVSGTSRPTIERYDPETAGTTLSATREWNLTADLPTLGANLGLEGIAWVPDSYLVASGFRDQRTGAAYSPATYANHGTGLFLVGVEQNGMVYAYALDQTSNAYTRVASFSSGLASVMELSWEPETQQLWVVCDDTCQGRSSRFAVNAAGFFAPTPYVERPAGMPNINNEGFTTTPRDECVAGLKPVFWADDNDTAGSSLRQGTVECTVLPVTPPGTTPPVTPPTTAPTTPPAVVPLDTTAPRGVKVRGVKKGGIYPGKRPRPRCSASEAVASCTITTRKKRVGRLLLVVATARATDAAGNTGRSAKTYLVRR
jgi:hypothetical protein